MKIETVFFDVGNTLVFMNVERTLAPLLDQKIFPTEEQLFSAERAAKKGLDAYYAVPHPIRTDHNYWDGYFSHLLAELKVPSDGNGKPDLKTQLIARARTSSNWNVILPGTCAFLKSLHERYRLAVISNADGHIRELLDQLGLAQFFDSFTDSGKLGVEKPDRRIFEQAMATVSAAPATSLYVGDIYSVDYLGAKNCGMNAVLLDRSESYRDSRYPRISSLDALAGHLEDL